MCGEGLGWFILKDGVPIGLSLFTFVWSIRESFANAKALAHSKQEFRQLVNDGLNSNRLYDLWTYKIDNAAKIADFQLFANRAREDISLVAESPERKVISLDRPVDRFPSGSNAEWEVRRQSSLVVIDYYWHVITFINSYESNSDILKDYFIFDSQKLSEDFSVMPKITKDPILTEKLQRINSALFKTIDNES